MLINLRTGTVFPKEYPETLVVEIMSNGEPSCGVFSGRNGGFRNRAEMDRRMPLVRDEPDGLMRYMIDRPSHNPGSGLWFEYHYVAMSLESEVYLEYPLVHTLRLIEDREAGRPKWSLYVKGPKCRFGVVLDDYRPGTAGFVYIPV